MQKYDEKIENLLKEVLEEFVFYNLDDARGDVRKNAKRVYTGYLTKNECEKTYTGLEERETLIRCGTVFFVNPQKFGAGLPGFLGLLKLEFHLRFDKKYFG